MVREIRLPNDRLLRPRRRNSPNQRSRARRFECGAWIPGCSQDLGREHSARRGEGDTAGYQGVRGR